MARVEDIVQHVKAMGQTAVALTEHGNVSSWPELDRQCAKHGIKPIFGIEANINHEGRIHHITLLAMDDAGIRSIYALVRRQQPPKGKLKVAWVTIEDVLALSEGVICLTGCLASMAARLDVDGSILHVEALQKAFGDRLYAEVQAHTFPEQIEHNLRMRYIASVLGLPVVLTYDAHYLLKEEVDIYFDAKSWGDDVVHRDQYNMYYGNGDGQPDCDMTLEIAARCTAKLPKWVGDGYLQDDRSVVYDTITKALVNLPEQYKQRLEYELKVINDFECAGYFVLLHNIVAFGREMGIEFGPGRGSAAGSLLAYVLGITQVDPIEHGLYFERFLNPGRRTLPDIDIDIQGDRREEFLLALQAKYGANNVAQVCTYLQCKASAAILAAARCLGIDHNEAYKYSKIVPDDAGSKWSLQKCFDEVQEFSSMPKEWARLAMKLEGTVKAFGVHAAAIIIAPNVVNRLPTIALPSATLPVLCYDMDDLEKMGLVKFDLLGLKTLTMLSKIKQLTGQEYKVPLDDEATYELISKGDTFGVFQLDSEGCQDVQKQLKPHNISDLSLILAAYRPGPLMSGMVDQMIQNKENSTSELIFDDLQETLGETYGTPLFQEQYMKAAQEVGGFSLSEGDLLRRAMGKKDASKMAELKAKFIEGGVRLWKQRNKSIC